MPAVSHVHSRQLANEIRTVQGHLILHVTVLVTH